MRNFKSLLCLPSALLLVSCSGGENAGDTDFQGNSASFARVLGVNDLKAWSENIQARGSWQSFGISVQKGQKIRIKSTGTWSGGQLLIGETEEDSELIFCDAAGCNGENHVPAAQYILPDPIVVSGVVDVCGREAGYVQAYTYHPDHIIENAGGTNARAGFLAGEADGSSACFGFNNILLGAEVPNLSSGHWRNRREAWRTNFELFIRCGYDTTNPAIVQFAQSMYELYRNATCSNPVTTEQVEQIIATARDAGFHWRGTEPVYSVQYLVDIPENNFKDACNNSDEIIVSYLFGRPNVRIPKNSCVKGILNSLVMKIVPDGTAFEDVKPVFVGKMYETEDYEVPTNGKVYFRNNDLDNGIGDNVGALNVKLELVTSTSP